MSRIERNSQFPGVGLVRVILILSVVGFFAALTERGQWAAAGTLRQGATPLVFGEPVSGTLDDAFFRRMYTFEARANEVVAITLERVEGDLDPYLLLINDRGTILALSDDDGPDTNAQVASKRLPADGRYFVIATRFGQEHGSTSGTYTLLLERVGAAGAETNTVQYGDSVLGRISTEAPLVFYFLRAQRGDVVNITLIRTSGDLDAHLDLATADGLILASNDDDPLAEGTLDAAITNFTVTETGLYLVVVTRFGREAGNTEGSYVLSITQTPPEQLGATPETARLIDYGAALDGVIDDTVPARYYRFVAQRGDVITALAESQSGGLDPLLKLVDANLVEIARDDDSAGERDARLSALTLPAAGTYYLVVTRSGELDGKTSGTYTLQLSGRAGIVGSGMLEIMYGATVGGTIEPQRSAEEYVFFGQRGDVIRIRMERTSGDLDPLVTLYDSERKQITFDDDSGEDQGAFIQSFELPRDDMYILVASRFEREAGKTTGAYLLSLELVRTNRASSN